MFNKFRYLMVLMSFFMVTPGLPQAQLSDPTAPPKFTEELNEVEKIPNTLKVSSIISSPHRKVAVIDGQILGIGDQGAGFTVLTIESGQVIVELADSTTKAISLRKNGIVHKVDNRGRGKNLDVASASLEGTE